LVRADWEIEASIAQMATTDRVADPELAELICGNRAGSPAVTPPITAWNSVHPGMTPVLIRSGRKHSRRRPQ
jgi:hypothetical protein